VYVCGLGGSDEIGFKNLKEGGAFDEPNKVTPLPHRIHAAKNSIGNLIPSLASKQPIVEQACLRPCAPDAIPLLVLTTTPTPST
jgi:glycine/D-amino acid oxidase-like deaminating enzyme